MSVVIVVTVAVAGVVIFVIVVVVVVFIVRVVVNVYGTAYTVALSLICYVAGASIHHNNIIIGNTTVYAVTSTMA